MIEKQEKFCRMFQLIREKYYEADDEAFEVLQEAFEDAVAELKESRDSLHEFLLALAKKKGAAEIVRGQLCKAKAPPVIGRSLKSVSQKPPQRAHGSF